MSRTLLTPSSFLSFRKSDYCDEIQGLEKFLAEKPAARAILISDAPRGQLSDRVVVIPPQLFLLLSSEA